MRHGDAKNRFVRIVIGAMSRPFLQGNWTRPETGRAWFAIVGVSFLFLWVAALWTFGGVTEVIEIGGDEHYEVMKALLWAQGISLYQVVWNDQPPLLTVVLGLAMRAFGANVVVVRAIATGFGVSLVAAHGVVVRAGSGVLAAVTAMLCLASAPGVMALCLSAMLEAPAIGMALWALYPILRWRNGGRWRWLALSSGLFAAALQIKLTALIALPALLVELVSIGPYFNCRAGRWGIVAKWVGMVGVAYTAGSIWLGMVRPAVFFAAHFSAGVTSQEPSGEGLSFLLSLFRDHWDGLCAAAVSLLVFRWRKDRASVRFPLIWLATATVVHSVHRPWWSIYLLHFAIPLSWIAGVGVARMVEEIGSRPVAPAGARFGRQWRLASLAVTAGLLFVFGAQRLWNFQTDLRHSPKIQDSRLILGMRRHFHETQWVYARDSMLPFHAGLPILPELAVLPAKRFWSGQISNAAIGSLLRRERPEQLLLLDREARDCLIDDFVRQDYRAVRGDGRLTLYVRRDLRPDD